MCIHHCVTTAGLAIWLESFSEESLCQTEAFGFKILIHPQNEYPFPDSLGFNLDTVSVLDIMLLQVKTQDCGPWRSVYGRPFCRSSTSDFRSLMERVPLITHCHICTMATTV